MRLVERLRYAFECGKEKADLVYKIISSKHFFEDLIYNEICNNLAETEQREKSYGFLERVAFEIGYSRARKG